MTRTALSLAPLNQLTLSKVRMYLDLIDSWRHRRRQQVFKLLLGEVRDANCSTRESNQQRSEGLEVRRG